MPDLSICIVTLNAREFLQNCLRSIYQQSIYSPFTGVVSAPESPATQPPASGLSSLSFEIIIVDNGSTDQTAEMVRSEFPQATLIVNETNMGFTRPFNQALRLSKSQYMLVLNPDTIILPGALDELVNYMNTHPDVGICGPKVLNRDGTLQKACRRGVSRPWAAISYFCGLYKLFPRSKFFGGYLLNYLDEDAICEVDGVSGSCMLIRREVSAQIGYFDEQFFAYQEDADYCFQAKKAGWKILYLPQSQIIHYGGQGGSRVQPYRSIYEWHRSYYLYYRKNLARDYIFLFNWFYYCLMGLKLLLALLTNSLRTEKFAGPKRG
jgi:hypothetical protein